MIKAAPADGDEKTDASGNVLVYSESKGAWLPKGGGKKKGGDVAGNESTEKAKKAEASTEGAKEGDVKPGPLGTKKYFWDGAWHNVPKSK